MNTIISAQELHAQVANPQLVILDARWDLAMPTWGREAYAEGHIPGAAYVSLDDDLAAELGPHSGRHPLPDVDEAAASFRRLGIQRDSKVVVYDQASGAFAARAWWMLRWLKHDAVAVLDGGLAAWMAERLPISTEPPAHRPGNFTGYANESWVVSAEDIPDLLARNIPLLDARDAARFAGREEPIDTVAGHIPGARNAAFQTFLNERSQFLPVPEILRRLTDEHGIQARQDWMVMCGSGVTACHLALSGCLAGLKMPRLYAGSWSEWIRDPSRAVAKTERV